MMQVQEELTTTENKIAFSRQAYNDSVMHFNVLRESFPDSIIANMFNFQAAQMFEVENEAVREVPNHVPLPQRRLPVPERVVDGDAPVP